MRTPKSIARSDLVGLICLSFMAGIFFMQAALGFARDESTAWIYVPVILGLAGAIVIVSRRTLRKIP